MMLSLDTAYRSFGGEVEASSTPTICRLSDSRRHQLSAIAPRLMRGMTELGRKRPFLPYSSSSCCLPPIGFSLADTASRLRSSFDLLRGLEFRLLARGLAGCSRVSPICIAPGKVAGCVCQSKNCFFAANPVFEKSAIVRPWALALAFSWPHQHCEFVSDEDDPLRNRTCCHWHRLGTGRRHGGQGAAASRRAWLDRRLSRPQRRLRMGAG